MRIVRGTLKNGSGGFGFSVWRVKHCYSIIWTVCLGPLTFYFVFENESEANGERHADLCSSCPGNKCCGGPIPVFPDESLYGTELCEDFEGCQLMKTSEGHCVALVKGRCIEYERRPKACRALKPGSPDCIAFRTGEVNAS